MQTRDAAPLHPGMHVGPWRVLSRCGGGAYGVVYRVVREGEAVPRALKMARYPRDQRFEREGELLSRIHHPHVPRLHDRGVWRSPGGVSFPYLVMDWIDGVPLYEWAEQHALTPREKLGLLVSVARALEATHAEEGVHRDVKGENILVRREDAQAVLVDFGSANFRGASVITRQPPPPGTPQYQSPESMQFEFEHLRQPTARYEAGPADDVYALGMTAYRLVTGRYPPPTVELEETEEGNRLIHLPLVPPEEQVTLSPELAALIRRMLSQDPAARGSAGELARALEHATRTPGAGVERLSTAQPALAQWLPKARTARLLHVLVGAPGLVAASVLLVGIWWSRLQTPVEVPEKVAQEPRDVGEQDAGTTCLGDAVSSAVARVEQPVPAWCGINLNMPKQPFPGQRRPPCRSPEVEINGGCWLLSRGAVTPPCGDRAYEWNKECYWPILEPPRPSTSDPQ